MTARPYRLGLTGSVGMGKSTTAGFFVEAGVPVWDADAAVHRLYAPGGAGAAALADLVPAATAGGAVDRERLRTAVAADAGRCSPRIEARVHPLVAADRAELRRPRTPAPTLMRLRYPAALRDRGRARARRRAGGDRARGGAAGAGAGAARHDRGDARARSWRGRCPTPRSGPAPTSSSTTDRGLDAARGGRPILARADQERSGAMREIVLDTETTGLDPDTGDRIVEIGAVELVNHMPTGRSFHRYINPAARGAGGRRRRARAERGVPRRQAGLRRHRRRVRGLPRRRPAGDPQCRLRHQVPERRARLGRAGQPALGAGGRHAGAGAAAASRGRRTASTPSAGASASTIPAATSTARCSTPSSWPRSTSS